MFAQQMSCLICRIDSVNNLREIQAMRRLSPHANLVELKEVILYVNFSRKVSICSLRCILKHKIVKYLLILSLYI